MCFLSSLMHSFSLLLYLSLSLKAFFSPRLRALSRSRSLAHIHHGTSLDEQNLLRNVSWYACTCSFPASLHGPPPVRNTPWLWSPKPKSPERRGSDLFRSWVHYRDGQQNRSPRSFRWTWVPGAYSYRWREGGDGPDLQKTAPQSS